MRFNKQLYDKHDKIGKDTAFSLLSQLGYTLKDDKEAYGSHDFIIERNNKEIKVEVEQKTGWKTIDFPFQTHDVPYRKRTSNAELFIQINNTGNSLAMCNMNQVKTSKVITKNTIYTNNEMFFAVPISNMRYFNKEIDGWYELTCD